MVNILFGVILSKYVIMASSFSENPFSIANFNPHILNVEYAVRGLIPTRALDIALDLKGQHTWPFSELTYLNLGNPQNLGQKPITFSRQLLSLCTYPALIDHPEVTTIYPSDVVDRAKTFLSSIPSFGGYTDSLGFETIRKEVALFISIRDHFEADYLNIFLSDGASKIIFTVISCLAKTEDNLPSGILIPIPQYPLYSACLSYFGIVPVPYYLDEDDDWSFNLEELLRALDCNMGKSIPRAMVVINPGNPTGQILGFDVQVNILKFCYEQRLLLLADEVYQDNIYNINSEWYSFRRVFFTIKDLIIGQQLVSFHSISKGFFGECGFRGGYAEILGMDQATRLVLTKLLSSTLCPNITGQLILSTYVNPPIEGEVSFPLFNIEKQRIITALQRKAQLVSEILNSINGIRLNPVFGAMYAFPKISLSKTFIDKSKDIFNYKNPDEFYCMQLLEKTGIVSVPGSGFGQKLGTWHFRITILPPEDKLVACLEKFNKFHQEICNEYSLHL